MELLLSIIFFIMFLVIIGVLIYLIYDFVNYKEAVDKTNEQDAKALKTTLESLTSNLTSNFILKNDALLLSQITTNSGDISRLTSRSSNLERNYADVDGNISDFDAQLKKFFSFKDNNSVLTASQKLYDYAFGSVTPDLDLITKVTATNGMTINTPNADMSFKICNNSSNCISLNVTDRSFNIKPANLDDMTFLSKSNKPLARFDMENDKLFFGGINDSAPMYIHNSNLYLNELNIRRASDGKALHLDGNSISQGLTTLNNSYDSISGGLTSLGTMMNTVNTSLNNVSSNLNVVVAHWQLLSDTPIGGKTSHYFTLRISSIYDIVPNTNIEVSIPLSHFTVTSTMPTVTDPKLISAILIVLHLAYLLHHSSKMEIILIS